MQCIQAHSLMSRFILLSCSEASCDRIRSGSSSKRVRLVSFGASNWIQLPASFAVHFRPSLPRRLHRSIGCDPPMRSGVRGGETKHASVLEILASAEKHCLVMLGLPGRMIRCLATGWRQCSLVSEPYILNSPTDNQKTSQTRIPGMDIFRLTLGEPVLCVADSRSGLN